METDDPDLIIYVPFPNDENITRNLRLTKHKADNTDIKGTAQYKIINSQYRKVSVSSALENEKPFAITPEDAYSTFQFNITEENLTDGWHEYPIYLLERLND